MLQRAAGADPSARRLSRDFEEAGSNRSLPAIVERTGTYFGFRWSARTRQLSQLVNRQHLEAFPAADEVVPELVMVLRSRKMTGNSDDRHAGLEVVGMPRGARWLLRGRHAVEYRRCRFGAAPLRTGIWLKGHRCRFGA